MNENLLTPHGMRIKIFMDNAGQVAPAVPTIPGEATRRLRAALILEECIETIAALGFRVETTSNDRVVRMHQVNLPPLAGGPDLEGIADGCADLSVVSIGTLIACGIPDAPVLEEVDASNLAKFAPPWCDGCNSVLAQIAGGYWTCRTGTCPMVGEVLEPNVGPWKDATGKVRKPRDWTPPNIARVLKSLA